MSARSTRKPTRNARRPTRGGAELFAPGAGQRRRDPPHVPPELANLPADLWDGAEVVAPKRAISLRLDEDVLDWFRRSGPRYQTRMNAVLRM